MPQFLVRPEDLRLAPRRAIVRGEEAHHLVRVLRMREGQPVDIFDGRGSRWRGLLALDAVEGVSVEHLEALPSNESSLSVELLHGLPKGEKWDWILEKSTELGVGVIQPLHTENSVPRIPAARLGPKLERWAKRLLAAAKQCERGTVPQLREPMDLKGYLAGLPAPAEGECRVVLDARQRVDRLSPPERSPHTVRIAVGPEGGWSDAERAALRDGGFGPLSLGPRVLRSETAALVGLAFVQSLWGDLVADEDGW